MTSPRIEDYLARIGHRGPVEPTLDTLTALHRKHLQAIPYENLDIHLGRRIELDPDRFFRKLVLEGRGGWCYEMNGLFAWALGELGFRVRMVQGTVGRDRKGDAAAGNHLVLLVELDRLYVADVGFGDGPLEPLPLEEGRYRVGFLRFGLERQGERWIFRNHEHGGADAFDFTTRPVELQSFGAKCHELQTSPDSGFVQKTVCQRYLGEELVTLRGAVERMITRGGVAERVIQDQVDYARTLDQRFGLRLPGTDQLWVRVWEKHLEWIGRLGAGG